MEREGRLIWNPWRNLRQLDKPIRIENTLPHLLLQIIR